MSTNVAVVNIDYLQEKKKERISDKICRVLCLSPTLQFTPIFSGTSATFTALEMFNSASSLL